MRKNSILILSKSDEKIIPIVKFLLDNYMNTIKVVNVTNESKDRVLNHYPTSYVHETLNDDISGILSFYRPTTIVNIDTSISLESYTNQIIDFVDSRKGKSAETILNILDFTSDHKILHNKIKNHNNIINDITFYGKMHTMNGIVPNTIKKLIEDEDVFLEDENVRLCDIDDLSKLIYNIHNNVSVEKIKPIECNRIWLANFLAVSMDKYLELKNTYHNKIYDSQRYVFSIDSFDKGLLMKVREILHWYITMIKFNEEL